MPDIGTQNANEKEHSVLLPDKGNKIEKGKKYKLKVYVLNKEKNDFLLDNFKLEVIPK